VVETSILFPPVTPKLNLGAGAGGGPIGVVLTVVCGLNENVAIGVVVGWDGSDGVGDTNPVTLLSNSSGFFCSPKMDVFCSPNTGAFGSPNVESFSGILNGDGVGTEVGPVGPWPLEIEGVGAFAELPWGPNNVVDVDAVEGNNDEVVVGVGPVAAAWVPNIEGAFPNIDGAVNVPAWTPGNDVALYASRGICEVCGGWLNSEGAAVVFDAKVLSIAFSAAGGPNSDRPPSLANADRDPAVGGTLENADGVDLDSGGGQTKLGTDGFAD
jgi:hypothetical protein